MNYTENYHLPQWEESDRVMRTDFNQMCADIDAGISQAAQMPFAVGSYVGTGREMDIEVGFRPSTVLTYCSQGGGNPTDGAGAIAVIGEVVTCKDRITMRDNGFRIAPQDTVKRYPRINEPNVTFAYIAFR